MNPSKLPSFKHDEFVKKWLSSAQLEPISTTRVGQDDERSHKPGKRSLDHASPHTHQHQHTSISGDRKTPRSVRQSHTRPPKKRQRESQSSPPAPNRAHHEPRDPPSDQKSPNTPQSAIHERQKAKINDRTYYGDRTASKFDAKRRLKEPQSNETKHDPSLKYARRPRHKTRVDRYEYKRYEEVKKVQKITGHSKRSARRKSGTMLNDEFRAPNVESERLTLKQPSGPGFLSRGKASIQAPRCGLPDLTFSEMAFLTKRRELDAVTLRGQPKQETTKKKSSKGSAQEISEFFATPTLAPATDQRGYRLLREPSEAHVSRNLFSPLDVAYKQALTGVSLNGLDQEPRTASAHSAADSAENWHPDSHDFRIQHSRPRIEGVLCETIEDRGTSYASWSPSIDPVRGRRHRGPAKHDVTKLNQDIYTVHPRSSVSNIIPHHGRDVPPKHQASAQTPGASATLRQAPGVFYSLDDLKILAKNLTSMEEEDSYHEARPRVEPLSSRVREHHLAADRVMNGTMARMGPLLRPVDTRKLKSLAEEIVDDDLAHSSRQHASYEGHETDSWLPHRLGVYIDSRGPQNTGPALWHADFTGQDGSAVDSLGLKRPEETCFEVFTRPSTNYNYGATRPETCHAQSFTSKNCTHDLEDHGLDAFDARLLMSAQMPDLDLRPGLDKPELASHLGWRASPRSSQRARADAEHETYSSGEHLCDGDVGRQVGSYSGMHGPFEEDSQPRPRLLLPSEDETLEPQPFTGFSMPWKLY